MTMIYLDACCLNRLNDDQSQHRIREEAEAVELILRRMHSGEVQWISSEALMTRSTGIRTWNGGLRTRRSSTLQTRPLKWIRRLPTVPRILRLRATEPLTPCTWPVLKPRRLTYC